jgi:hypothetical protein
VKTLLIAFVAALLAGSASLALATQYQPEGNGNFTTAQYRPEGNGNFTAG